ncbi:Ferroporti-1 [Clohesyomyces aquaticus]|uniref:Solute carrier family 40 member n=1 Tax=Clohesyomyces aquaticus TaxID=1231657 RepID=A0A1Y1ZWS1_9PLEO|nr:Ferroporti-1 [Clohesyomyces aquaticus]
MGSTSRSSLSITPEDDPHDLIETNQPSLSETRPKPARRVLLKLYLSHTLSTWNARMFEFGAVIFIAKIFPDTLFYTSCYALFRSAAAVLLSSRVGGLVDRTPRLQTVRQSIIWQRVPVAVSCILLLLMQKGHSKTLTLFYFMASVGLAGVEKVAFIANTISVERDWIIVISDEMGIQRKDLNGTMRRIDLVCKLAAPLGISLVDGWSTRTAILLVFVQNACSVLLEYFAIAQVFHAVPGLGKARKTPGDDSTGEYGDQIPPSSMPAHRYCLSDAISPYKEYVLNPAFLASLSLSLLYLTVLSFASQMTTYLLSLGFTSLHISLMRLVAVVLELSATCAAPVLMGRIGATRSGLWFINEQLLSVLFAAGLFFSFTSQDKLTGAVLVIGVTLSRLGLFGFDLCVQYLVQEDAPEATRGSFSAVEAALQNMFELISFAITMIFHRPDQFKIPILVSASAVAVSAVCFAGFVRHKRGHLLHTSKCFKRAGKGEYHVLPTIEEELEEFSRDAGEHRA